MLFVVITEMYGVLFHVRTRP